MQAIKSEAALEIIGKLLYNAAVAPKEEKFRCAGRLTTSLCCGAVVGAAQLRLLHADAGVLSSCALPMRPTPATRPPSQQPTRTTHARNPRRKIKLTNAKIRETVVETAGGVEALRALGWVEDPEAPEESLVMPAGLYYSMKEVRVVEAAKEKLRKDARSSSNKNLAGMVTVQA